MEKKWPACRRSPICSTSTAVAAQTLALIAQRREREIGDLTVVVLDRPRHEQGVEAIRKAGARVRLIAHGDVSASLLAVTGARPSTSCGGSGAPEGRHLGGRDQVRGQLLGRLWPRDERPQRRARRG